MLVIPSVDIKEGRVVRILRGDPSREILSLPSPREVAESWRKKGAKYLHVVDLSAVFGGRKQFDVIKEVLSVGVPASVGGGIRSADDVAKYIEAGADAVVVSTMFVEKKREFERVAEKFPHRIILALDFTENFEFALRGWREKHGDIFSALREVKGLPLSGFMFTAVFKDGTGEGVPKEHFKKISDFICAEFGQEKRVIASGGVSSRSDLVFLAKLGFWGAIVGRAFYEGKINVFEVDPDEKAR